jgi:7-cyano-7-deazaguanine synthase
MSAKQESKTAILLLSGGLDSATVLAVMHAAGWRIHALSFNYGQRHALELAAAKRLAQHPGVVAHTILDVPVGQLGGSSLTDTRLQVPEDSVESGIPNTYVPARNLIFLSFAAALAETQGVSDLFLGVNAVDYSGYPDCRPEFIEAFERTVALGTKAGDAGANFQVHTPLIQMTKAQIIAQGMALGVDYGKTISCYQIDERGRACGRCDSCRFRHEGFVAAGFPDPTAYVTLPDLESSL